MVVDRQNFRQQKDYGKADELQTKLKELGILVGKDGGAWTCASGICLSPPLASPPPPPPPPPVNLFFYVSFCLFLCSLSVPPLPISAILRTVRGLRRASECYFASPAQRLVCTVVCVTLCVCTPVHRVMSGRWPWRPCRVQPPYPHVVYC